MLKQLNKGISSVTKHLPAVGEGMKEKIDPRRSTINPYWQAYNGLEKAYESSHGKYHSRQRHGAEHSLDNIHARTQASALTTGPLPYTGPLPTAGNLAKTGKSAMIHEGVQVPGYVSGGVPMPSGRFTTPAWHIYSLNVAQHHASIWLPAGVTWPAGSPPKIPNGNYHRFTIEYQGSPAGLSVQAAGPETAQAAHFVLVGIQHNPATNEAWVIQHFPQTAAATPGAVIPNHVTAYEDIPWF